MEQEVVQRVLDVEKEIHELLSEEKRKAAQWVESVRKSCDAEIQSLKNQLEKDFASAIEKARSKAQKEADELIKEATTQAHILDRLNKDSIRRIILKYLTGILPGEANDSEDVKS